ncbi:dihydroxyacetone kinase subunit DhaK [Nakamurella flavida]|uniref:phosphoenolpyruvate--glycerone phosphotransferase n=1 Tax=Nakamurella flavida TaxID=363630 RepID=A0A938YQM9_9ACTN|nr:dihydroxyacetone kinase subunit DhaK [Nakamurella flavida]MBM9477175.1 dihydroxyacetone kinase subunit DhaK [Nakamurella flavida]MDP9780124.1 dihydroxyacetone kinase-like protein [Nakamurella flavida]
MKKIINDPADVVRESLQGFALAHPDLVTLSLDPLFVARATPTVRGTVAVVSGGGSGHEPLHAGFVGDGMLDAAVPGTVFSSPTPDQVVAAAHAVHAGAGILLVVKNYTGDVLNFETAAELLQADGIEVRTVIVDDDVAVRDSTFTAGRRGVGGTVLLEKIVGAAVARGDDLDTVHALAERVVGVVRSMGVALRPSTVPHSGEPSFTLGEDEMEFGVGIHGEPGRERRAMLPADGIVALLLEAVVTDLPFAAGDRVIVLLNGLGGTPLMELYLAYGSVRGQLESRGITVARSLVGNYVTALEMQGMSITMLQLDDEMMSLWDAPVHTAALRWGV